jgi:hypothetical protein
MCASIVAAPLPRKTGRNRHWQEPTLAGTDTGRNRHWQLSGRQEWRETLHDRVNPTT